MSELEHKTEYNDVDEKGVVATPNGLVLNASGHEDVLTRQYSIWSLIGLALTVDNAWIALGGSLYLSLYNGGPPGILYELIVAVIYYLFIGACIAEFASAIPSAGGVYHWASITPGPGVGRMLGFFTGSINFFGWMFDLASIAQIEAEVSVQLYASLHTDLVIQPWHTYVAFLLLTWLSVLFCIFCNNLIPKLQNTGLFIILAGGLTTIIVLAAMPKQHASTATVFRDWENGTGWPSGVAFLTGCLNGAFTIGTPDAITHLAEELPNPARDLPKAIFIQIGLGGITAFLFAVAVLYGINDFSAVQSSNGAFPLAEAYNQATGSAGATFGLLFIIFLSLLICLVGTFLTLSRIWWALARDNATPFSSFFSKVNTRLSCPVPALILIGILDITVCVICTGLGAITLGSKTAFADLAGSFIILSTTSYALPIIGHLAKGRRSIRPGPFWMGKAGFPVQIIAVLAIIIFNIFYCFPPALPTTTESMNYNSVILVGVLVLTAIWWVIHGMRKYEGPKIALLHTEGIEPVH
ncbi:choline transport protein [Microthyrium microscopicum]|uniref:Choline transport protein n=1 Tax=Microthyrium microscopicum TaxID=703497 RepID=A0A6A6U5A8_9PEZI|nr:choline transport protein [Microthyrium microscopicum]